ncbi:MAG: hypothetical protein ACKOA8_04860 [Deltaproteobacteria bacterium]
MKNLLFVLISLVACGFSGNSLAATQSLSDLGYRSMQQTWTELKANGLLEMDPYDPRLPYPQTPALRAVVSRRLGLLAYFNEENGFGGTTLVFKNPNGGYRHSVSFNRDRIKFVTPYMGTVAHANRFTTVGGPGYNFYCQSQPVTEYAFYQCIDSLFIKAIVNQLNEKWYPLPFHTV